MYTSICPSDGVYGQGVHRCTHFKIYINKKIKEKREKGDSESSFVQGDEKCSNETHPK